MQTATPPSVRPPRRSQNERSASARLILINATLLCLKEVGLAKTSITEICHRAGVSRGALLHHFPHKNDLLVAAYMAWIEGKLTTLEHLIHEGASVREEVAAWRSHMQGPCSMTLEFYWALRNDDDLRERFNTALLTHTSGDDVSLRLPRTAIDAGSKPSLTRYVIACFIRGLCLQEMFVRDPSTPEQAFDHFVAILSAFTERPVTAHA